MALNFHRATQLIAKRERHFPRYNELQMSTAVYIQLFLQPFSFFFARYFDWKL